jgi:hypothetical protein
MTGAQDLPGRTVIANSAPGNALSGHRRHLGRGRRGRRHYSGEQGNDRIDARALNPGPPIHRRDR